MSSKHANEIGIFVIHIRICEQQQDSRKMEVTVQLYEKNRHFICYSVLLYVQNSYLFLLVILLALK